MKKVYVFLFLFFYVNAQVVLKENFNDFRFSSESALTVLDANDSLITDRVGANTFTVASATSGKVLGGILLNGGYSEHFSNNGHYTKAEPTTLDFTGSFAVSVAVWHETFATSQVYFAKNNDGASQVQYYANYWASDARLRFSVTGATSAYRRSASALSDSTWYIFTFVYNASAQTLDIYRNGVLDNGSLVGTVPSSLTDYAHAVRISGNDSGTNRLRGYLENVKFFDGLPTSQQIAESGFLAANWVSKNGNVTRENLAFYQTFWDTIGVPLSNATLDNNQVWQLSYKGKSSDATKTIKAWIGSAASAKSSVYTVTAGTAFATNTVNFGDGFALSSDTLWFASASTADTVSVDDVVLSKTYLSGKKINSWSKH